MGVNNKQRRAAKQRRRARAQSPGQGPGPGGSRTSGGRSTHREFWTDGVPDGRVLADLEVAETLRAMVLRSKSSEADGERQASWLLMRLPAGSDREVGAALGDLLRRLHRQLGGGGWPAADLAELVRRRIGESGVDLLSRTAASARSLAMPTEAGLGLRIAALLSTVPVEPRAARSAARPPAARSAVSEADTKRLATVRALLAKAERTSFDEEADALSAKAQELISKHALERLLAQTPDPDHRGSPVSTRRFWLEAPYLMAKAALVDEVAAANRCRCIVSESFGFCSLVGDPRDLDDVELLSTSLLVQANRSMLRHGRQLDWQGVSRTRSFRQSFLVSFAHRIGQRLREVDQETMAQAEPGTELVAVLRRREQQVDDAFAAMFPNVVQTSTSVTNGLGWAAGRVAADQALIDLNGRALDPQTTAG